MGIKEKKLESIQHAHGTFHKHVPKTDIDILLGDDFAK